MINKPKSITTLSPSPDNDVLKRMKQAYDEFRNSQRDGSSSSSLHSYIILGLRRSHQSVTLMNTQNFNYEKELEIEVKK